MDCVCIGGHAGTTCNSSPTISNDHLDRAIYLVCLPILSNRRRVYPIMIIALHIKPNTSYVNTILPVNF